MVEQVPLIIVNTINLAICLSLTVFGFMTNRIAYHLLVTNPKVKNEESNRFYYGRWRKIGGGGYLFFGLALLAVLLNWLLLLHGVALIVYVLVVVWSFKWDGGRLENRVLRDIP